MAVSTRGGAKARAAAAAVEPTETPRRSARNKSKAASRETAAAERGGNGEASVAHDSAMDKQSPTDEFGGPVGNLTMMAVFPCLIYYLWYCAYFNNGQLYGPPELSLAGLRLWLGSIGGKIATEAYPNARAWAIYWGFIVWQGIMYLYMPGLTTKGLPLENGERLDYYCSGYSSYYATLVVYGVLQFSGVFKLYTILDEFGSLLSVAIISAFALTIGIYILAKFLKCEYRPSGNVVHDVFMGTVLNPRIGHWLDLKMFFEVRFPWYVLSAFALGAAARQYDQYGSVSTQVWFMVLATYLYANSCSKGEQHIIPSWDMYREKWGFILIFWNLAGVPFSYCHSIIFLDARNPNQYDWPWYYNLFCYTQLLCAYYVFDTCNGQKNIFRQEILGAHIERWAFPTLPWTRVKNPTFIKCANGGTLLTSGWCKSSTGSSS